MGAARKIAILGLLPQQVAFIDSEFPDLRIRFLSKEQHGGALSASVANVDQVVVMTRFIDHSIWRAMPREKVTYCNGGMSTLRHQLTALRAAYPPQPQQSAVVPEPEAPASEEPEMKSMSYAAIRTAPVGEALYFKRPKSTTLTTFEKQVGEARSYYSRRYGVETEQNVTDDGQVRVVVTKRLDQTRLAESLTPAPAPAPTSTPEPAPAPDTKTTDAYVHEGRRQPFSISDDKLFWSDVFLSRMAQSPGSQVQTIINFADAALEARRRIL